MIQWYPGHMAKARREIGEKLKLVDVVLELADARIPSSSRNPGIEEIQRKPHILILTKGDLADEERTNLWVDYWRKQGEEVIVLDVLRRRGLNRLKDAIKKVHDKNRQPRVLVVGIPNVGKSSLINQLAQRSSAKIGAKPGVTRSQQWVKGQGFQLLDTPGLLWPKFDDQMVAQKLAVVSSIRDEILDIVELAKWLIDFLIIHYPEKLIERYKLENLDDVLVQIAHRRGCLRKGGELDFEQAAQVVLKDFRTGSLGRISLEVPGEDLTDED